MFLNSITWPGIFDHVALEMLLLLVVELDEGSHCWASWVLLLLLLLWGLAGREVTLRNDHIFASSKEEVASTFFCFRCLV
jgi:hypothetical protein